MIFDMACLAGLILVFVVLVKGLQQSAVSNGRVKVPPIIDDVESSGSCWRNDTNILAADRAEYFDLLEKHSADPLNIPPPIPPAKPHPYWGNETDVFGNNSPCSDEFD